MLISSVIVVLESLSKQRRVQFVLLLLLMLFGGLAEIIGIGAIIPFLTILVDPQQVLQLPAIEQAMSFLGYNEISDPRKIFTLLFIIAVVVSGVIRYLLIFFIAKFIFSVGSELGIKIYSYALYKPYQYHINKNSSEILSGIVKLDQLVWVMFSLINMISASVMAVFIVLFLLFLNPLVAIVAFCCLGGAYILIFFISNKTLSQNSMNVSKSSDKRIQVIQEGLGCIRDVLLTNTQKLFIRQFTKMNELMYRAHASNNIIGPSPRFIVEPLGLVLISFFAYFSIVSGSELSSVLPMFGALALGAQRLMPLIQQLYQGWTQVVGNGQILCDVAMLLKPSSCDEQYIYDNQVLPLSFCKEIKYENVSFKYNEGEKFVIDDINISIKKGQRIGFIGTTGSGKSTLIDLLMGLIEPTNGTVLVDGVGLNKKNTHAWQKNISHVPQNIYLLDSSFTANIAFGIPKSETDFDLVRSSADQAKLSKFIESNSEGYDAMLGERGVRLSGGQKQRVGIARALYNNTKVLILDEATSALDGATEKDIMDSIHDIDDEITVIIIAHRLSTVKGCDWIYKLKDGKVELEGTPKEILGDN